MTREVEARGSEVQGPPQLHETLAQKETGACFPGSASFRGATPSSRFPESAPELTECMPKLVKKGGCRGGEYVLPQARLRLSPEHPAYLPGLLPLRPQQGTGEQSEGRALGRSQAGSTCYLPESPTAFFPLKLFPCRDMLRFPWQEAWQARAPRPALGSS